MRLTRRRAAVLAAATLAGCATSRPLAPARLEQIDALEAPGLAPRPVTIWLPPGYDDGAARYPVIYAQDGQNLFEPGRAFGSEEWGLDETMDRRVRAGVPAAIVVGIWNTDQRWRDYAPAKVVARLPAAVQALAPGAPLSDAYVRALVDTLKPRIDDRFRTRPNRAHTFLMGSSMGGLISLYAMAEAPETFGGAACLSIHWPLAIPGPQMDAIRGDVIRAFADYLRAARLDPNVHKLWIDQGTIGLDATYGPYREALEPVFADKGFVAGPRFQSRIYTGTDHNEAAWRARLDEPVGFLLA